jgi:hypothetical protein
VSAARQLLLVAALAAAGVEPLVAQQPGGLGIRASRRDTVRAGATITAAFLVANRRDDTATVRMRLELPSDWIALTGGETLRVAPQSSEMLILSLAVPGRTLAGVYPVRVWVTSAADPEGVADSVVVRVPARVATDVTLLDRPGFVVSGRAYEAGFQVRNRGNRASSLRIRVRSSVGAASLSDTLLVLAPNESRVVRARVRTPEGMNAAVDDVVEVVASYADADLEPIRGSSRVTVVPEPSRTIDQFLRIPARVNLRAATAEGVSPLEVFGQGLVRDRGETRLDFMFRGPTGTASAFGERDEYRAELRAPAWRVRGGDHMFTVSSLTAAGQPGFGVGADGDRGIFSAGAYSQRFRRVPEGGDELGAFVGARPADGSTVSLNLVNRSGGALPGTIGSATALLERWGTSSELEYARSSGGTTSGEARTARVSARTRVGSFDFGHLFADTGFTGAQRGAEHNYMTASMQPLGVVAFGVNGSRHRTDLSRATGVPYEDRFRTAALSATVLQKVTVEAGNVGRETIISGARQQGTQWSLRSRADHDFMFGSLTLEVERGRAEEAGAERWFTDITLGARRPFRWGHASMYTQRYSGGGITKGADGSRTLGGDASVRVRKATHATLIAYATRQDLPAAQWHSQLDALVSRGVRNGAIVSLRARMFGGGSRAGSQQSVVYLEYGMPMRLPVGPLRTPGRVTGKVTDAVSGRGVPGALVRLGPQVAITDRNGQVSFGGVPGGQHRLSMSQETSFANAVFVGDPTLLVDSARHTPTTFSLAIARSARVDVDVRRFALTRTTAGAGSDSLRESGAVSNATLVLAGERDTLYRSTGDDGRAVFTDIPPGKWSLSIRGDLPAFTRFDPDRLELSLEPGEQEKVGFRLLPRRREVQMIGDGQELRPTTVDPRGATPAAAGTKAVKPDEKRPDRE